MNNEILLNTVNKIKLNAGYLFFHFFPHIPIGLFSYHWIDFQQDSLDVLPICLGSLFLFEFYSQSQLLSQLVHQIFHLSLLIPLHHLLLIF